MFDVVVDADGETDGCIVVADNVGTGSFGGSCQEWVLKPMVEAVFFRKQRR